MTLIKKYFESESELNAFLNSRFPIGHSAEKLKIIIRIGFLNDLLAEPKGKKELQNRDSYISWLETKYLKAIENKTEKRVGNPMNTVPDSIIDLILSVKFNYTGEEVKQISKQHRLSMQAENLVGSFLEEYLDEQLSPSGWICCYGETLKYSDFCHPSNYILQVKNRDNTENSSSSKIRDNNSRIKMWFRLFSQTGRSNWQSIYKSVAILDIDVHPLVNNVAIELSEDNFRSFVANRVRSNPRLFFN